MTVIAYDGNFLVADRIMLYGSLVLETTKIRLIDGGNINKRPKIVAFCGSLDYAMEIINFLRLRNTSTPVDWPKFQNTEEDYAQMIMYDKGIKVYDRTPFATYPESNKLAWGAGASVALGALKAGASAIEAIKIASEINQDCGKGIDYFNVKTFEKGSISEKLSYN